MNEERQMVLRMLKEGKITLEEAEALMDALAEVAAEPGAVGPAPEMPGAPPQPPAPPVPPPAPERPPAAGHTPSLGEEIRSAVRRALEGARPGEAIGHSMREVGRVLREELKGMKFDVDLSMHDMVRDLFGLASATEEVEFNQAIAPGGRLIVRNPRGDVRLVRGTSGEVRGRGTKRVWWRTVEDASRLLTRLQVRAVPQGPDVLVEPVVEDGMHLRYRVDLVVEVPEGVGAEIDVRSGDVNVVDLNGDLDVRLASGDLAVGAHRGRVRAAVRSGDVAITEADGLDARVQSGDLEVGQVRGAADIQVASGDVSVKECRGDFDAAIRSGDLEAVVTGAASARAKVMSGDAEITFPSLAAGARVALEVLAGDVDVRLGPGIQATVRAQALSGDIAWALPLQNLQKSRGRVEGTLGTPDATIDVRVLSGDLSLETA